jgi:hypothetical protein
VFQTQKLRHFPAIRSTETEALSCLIGRFGLGVCRKALVEEIYVNLKPIRARSLCVCEQKRTVCIVVNDAGKYEVLIIIIIII